MLDEATSRALQGPFLVASVHKDQKYVLSNADGTVFDGGRIVSQNSLKLTR